MGDEISRDAKAADGAFCRFCGAAMPAGAARCNACQLLQDWTKSCLNCGAFLPSSARYCKNCGTYQGKSKECVSCGGYIPEKARICPKCNSVQAFRGLVNVSQVTLSLLIALLSVAGIVVPALKGFFTPSRSRTSLELIEIVGTGDESRLLLLASNSGNRPSYLRTISIEFKEFPQANRPMSIGGDAAQRLLKPGEQKLFWLNAEGFKFSSLGIKGRDDPIFKTKLLGGAHVLKAEVVGIGESQKPIELEASPELLEKFIDGRAG
ncbi:MAG TPA: zinc ribbon domain-containing protein [Thermoanaerobaculia bacterium]|jgi:ribosomal protein L40E|nr:zinc ribbon domain-containing protein [Thermoanaerobaculia bacterium]